MLHQSPKPSTGRSRPPPTVYNYAAVPASRPLNTFKNQRNRPQNNSGNRDTVAAASAEHGEAPAWRSYVQGGCSRPPKPFTPRFRARLPRDLGGVGSQKDAISTQTRCGPLLLPNMCTRTIMSTATRTPACLSTPAVGFHTPLPKTQKFRTDAGSGPDDHRPSLSRSARGVYAWAAAPNNAQNKFTPRRPDRWLGRCGVYGVRA